MPSAAFVTWLNEFSTTRIVLAELQPAEILSGWSATGGSFTNTHEIAWANAVQAEVVPGGIYRRLDGVRQNDLDLTARASVAEVDANAGSYFHDTANGVLYVRTTTGSAPDEFAALLAFFTIFVGTDAVDFEAGELYEPRIVGDLPVVTLEADDPLHGAKRYGSGDIVLANSDGLFDRLVRLWVWKNKLVTLKLGGGDLAASDYETIAQMRIEDVTPNDDVCRFTLRNMATVLDKYLPLNTFSANDYPHIGEGLEGTYKPLLYGAKTNIPGLLIDSTGGAQVYMVADPAAQVLTAVLAVRAIERASGVSTLLTLTTDYTVNLAACTVTVTNATYSADNYDLRIDATGESDGTGGYLSTFGQIARDILITLDERAALLDDAAFATADTDAPAPLGVWMREGKNAQEYIRLLEASVNGAVFIGRDGRWTAQIWDPTYDPTTAQTIVDEDIDTWDPDDKVESIFPVARVLYDENPATGATKVTEASNDTIRYAYETSDSRTVRTALINAGDAAILAARYRLMVGSPTIHVNMAERGLSGMLRQPFDKVVVTRRRAPTEAGLFDGQVMEVLRVEKQLAAASVAMRLGDLRGFGNRVGRWADSAAPDWGAASAAERERDGYWSDSAGLIDPSDPSTAEQSVWW
ncbi:MAG: hypothetical protein AB7Q16_21255 [Vicinamibacterales bacterium]